METSNGLGKTAFINIVLAVRTCVKIDQPQKSQSFIQ